MSWQKFCYKLSKDLLISLMITYFFLLIPELILPGIISSHLSPKYILALLILVAWLFAWLAKNFGPPRENIRFRAISRSLLNGLLVVITIMLILSLYKMKIWQIIVVSLFVLFIFAAAEKMFISEE